MRPLSIVTPSNRGTGTVVSLGGVWPGGSAKRRPVIGYWIANSNASSELNPGGYFNDSSFDASNSAQVLATLQAAANNIIGVAADINSQAVIIWNLEGEEYPHVFSYVANPMAMPSMHPTINAHLDTFFAMLRNAGLEVGCTLRPSYFSWGTTFPTIVRAGQWHYKTDNAWKNKIYFTDNWQDGLGLRWIKSEPEWKLGSQEHVLDTEDQVTRPVQWLSDRIA